MLLQVTGPAPVYRLEVDLLDDGQPAVLTVEGTDLRPVGALWFRSWLPGRFRLQVRARDACGQTDATGISRPVEVTP